MILAFSEILAIPSIPQEEVNTDGQAEWRD
jgi:hypothetical protein